MIVGGFIPVPRWFLLAVASSVSRGQGQLQLGLQLKLTYKVGHEVREYSVQYIGVLGIMLSRKSIDYTDGYLNTDHICGVQVELHTSNKSCQSQMW